MFKILNKKSCFEFIIWNLGSNGHFSSLVFKNLLCNLHHSFFAFSPMGGQKIF